MTEALVHFTLQIAVILLVAKLFGEIFEKLGQSSVLGELIAGMAIGPYALGAVDLPFIGPLFPLAHQIGGQASNIPVSPELYMFAQLGAIILLFLVGLETDAKRFMKYGLRSLGIAIGGVVLPFLFGAYATVLFGFASSIMDGTALFIGAIMTATSVGITARVLSDMYKLDTPEGVSILAAAVIDDVVGILILALVLSMAGSEGEVAISWGIIGFIALKALGFIGVVTALGIIFGKKLSNFLLKLQGKTYVAVATAICFLIAALAEEFGLAMIIGAYLAGILLSVTEIGKELEEKLAWVSYIIVPVFFAVMGMLVDFKAMLPALGFGLVITVLAIIGKVFGSGIPALFSGFNKLGAWRIGFGMLPRGEVALIVAGIGLSAGIINQQIFGVSILMTIITTLMAPLVLVPLFKKDKSGLRVAESEGEAGDRKVVVEPMYKWRGSEPLINFFRDALLAKFQEADYTAIIDDYASGIFELEYKQDASRALTIRIVDHSLTIDTSDGALEDVRRLVSEAQVAISEQVKNFQPQTG